MIINQDKENHLRFDIPLNKLHEMSIRYTIPRVFSGAKYIGLASSDLSTFNFQYIGLAEIKDYCHQLSQYYSLHQLQNIKALGVWFSKNHQMSDETLKWVVRLLKMNFASLTSLKVILVDCYCIKDKGMENLSQIARHLPQLKQLEIHCYSSYGINGQGFEILGYKLSRNLKNLESLSLSLEESSEDQKDPEFESLVVASMGKYFSRLKSLVLNFTDSESLTNKSLDVIVQQVCKNFKGLQKFELVIARCEKIDYEKLGHIPEILSFIPQFKLRTKQPW